MTFKKSYGGLGIRRMIKNSSSWRSFISSLALLRCGAERYLGTKLKDLLGNLGPLILYIFHRARVRKEKRWRKPAPNQSLSKYSDWKCLPPQRGWKGTVYVVNRTYTLRVRIFFTLEHVQEQRAKYREGWRQRRSSKQFCQALKYKRAGLLLSRMMALNIHLSPGPLCITSRRLLCLRNFYP